MSKIETIGIPRQPILTARAPPKAPPQWTGGKLEAWMTRVGPGGKRVRQGKPVRINAKKTFFHWPHSWSKQLYYIDPEGILFYAKRPVIVYDTAYAEPLSETNPILVHKPVQVKLEPLGSQWLNLLVTERSFAHLYRATSDEKQKFNIMWLMMIALGFLMGWVVHSIMGVIHA